MEDDFFSLNSNELLSLSILLTVVFSNQLNANQLNILGNFLCSLGQNILVIQAVIGANPNPKAIYTICSSDQTSTTNENNSNSVDTATQLSELESKINTLTEKMTTLESTFKKT